MDPTTLANMSDEDISTLLVTLRAEIARREQLPVAPVGEPLEEVTEEMVTLSKKAVGITKKVDVDWISNLQALTNEVQDNLEDALGDGTEEDGEEAEEAEGQPDKPLPKPLLTVETFMLFLRLQACKTSLKRPADGGLTEHERAEELKKDHVTWYTCMALMACIAWDKGIGAIEDLNLDEKIDKAAERGTEKGDERAEELQELQDKATEVQNELEGLYQDACVNMQDAILSGDRAGVLEVLASGQFALDLGY